MNDAAPNGWAVEIDGLAKSYRRGWTGGRTAAVNALTLRVGPGQVFGLLGPNGSGKSTILKTLAGMIRPTVGVCRIFGHEAGSDEARALVGFLPESPQFAPHLTGFGLLRFCAGLSSIEPGAMEARITEVLGWCGLGAAAGQRVGTFSKGMMQRLGLAQAVLHDPALVLLDEPASGLDPEGRLQLGRLIRELAARGKTVVFSSHLLDQAAGLCDRIALLGHGRLLATGTPADLLGVAPTTTPEPTTLERLYLAALHEGG